MTDLAVRVQKLRVQMASSSPTIKVSGHQRAGQNTPGPMGMILVVWLAVVAVIRLIVDPTLSWQVET